MISAAVPTATPKIEMYDTRCTTLRDRFRKKVAFSYVERNIQTNLLKAIRCFENNQQNRLRKISIQVLFAFGSAHELLIFYG